MPVLVDAYLKGQSVRQRTTTSLSSMQYLRHDPAVANMIPRPRPPQRVIPIHPIPSHAQPTATCCQPTTQTTTDREGGKPRPSPVNPPSLRVHTSEPGPKIGSTSSNMSSQRRSGWIGTISLGWLAGWLAGSAQEGRRPNSLIHTWHLACWRGTLPSQAYRDHGGRRATRAVGSFLA